MLTREKLAGCYVAACIAEVGACKPGNVSIHAEGHDMTASMFLQSAQVSAEPLTNPAYTLGEKIYHAIVATRSTVSCNTNLGIVLLCAPLLQALQSYPEQALRQGLASVLANTTQNDAAWVFRAICHANPGGLGRAENGDVHDQPEMTLTAAMTLAAERDRIARQYGNTYEDIFEFTIPHYRSMMKRWGNDEWAQVAVFVRLLKTFPDSHIERKFGDRFTRMIMTRMAQLEDVLSRSEAPEQNLKLFLEADAEFKALGINPGTSADLVVTTGLVTRLDGLLVSTGRV